MFRTMSCPKSNGSRLMGYRHLVAILGFLTFFFINVQQLSTAIVIVAMVNHTYNQDQFISTNSSKVGICMHFNDTSDKAKVLKEEGEFNWTSEMQGYILGIYFIGMISSYLPSAKLGEIFQARRVTFYSCFLASVASLLAPLASRWTVYGFMVVQLLRGVGAGAMNTSVFTLMGNWFPKSERGLLSTFVLSGFPVGAIFATSISGWICEHPSLGWPVVFYMSGCLGILHAIFLYTNLYERPKSCPRISDAELKFFAQNEEQVPLRNIVSPPWYEIFTSIPTYGLIIGIFGHYWMLSYFWSLQSTFLGTVLNFRIMKNGFASALPFLIKVIGENLSSALCHWLLAKKIVGVNALRKSCNTIGSAGIAASILGMYFGGCNDYVIVGSSLSTMFFVGVSTPGILIVCMDMSPRFAGSLAGMLNSIGGTPSFILPVLVGYLTENETMEEWQLVFLLNMAIVTVSALIFAVFGSAELQPWNFVKDDARDAMDALMNLNEHENENKKNSSMIANV